MPEIVSRDTLVYLYDPNTFLFLFQSWAFVEHHDLSFVPATLNSDGTYTLNPIGATANRPSFGRGDGEIEVYDRETSAWIIVPDHRGRPYHAPHGETLIVQPHETRFVLPLNHTWHRRFEHEQVDVINKLEVEVSKVLSEFTGGIHATLESTAHEEYETALRFIANTARRKEREALEAGAVAAGEQSASVYANKIVDDFESHLLNICKLNGIIRTEINLLKRTTNSDDLQTQLTSSVELIVRERNRVRDPRVSALLAREAAEAARRAAEEAAQQEEGDTE